MGDVSTKTDVLVIGAGPGGYVAAIRAAQKGLDVTLVERTAVGGTCLNHGCIPSKALITGANVAEDARTAKNIGVSADIDVDLDTMVDWKDGIVDQLTGGVETLCEQNGIHLMEGLAIFADETTARLIHEGEGEGSESIDFDHAIVATGSRPIEIPGFSFGDTHVRDSKQMLALDSVPDELVVIGAGYIGMELSTAFAKLGADVTVVEMLDHVLPGYGQDVSRIVQQRAESLGIEFHFDCTAQGYEPDEDGVVVQTETDSEGAAELPATEVLVAVGREPVTDTVELEAAGVETDVDGFIVTDEQCRTSVDNIFAIGDVAGEPMLAHQAMYEGRVAAEVVAGEPAGCDARAIPAVVFTDPEIATVGMTEEEATNAGFETVTGRMPLRSSGRALTLDDTDGFVRIVADADHETILGAQLVAPEASELVAELGLAVELGATLTDVAGTIHAHPTLSEAVQEAVENALGCAIHTTN
ncbi:dihydrolipoyl dehydrogenase (plasmid) [Natronosalvus halobius]|nr:dihydrolipoyl dehydrogenase [Natronosalvus halobius]